MKKTPPIHVGRGSVPRHRACTCNPTLAGEARSDARVASEGPALRKKRLLGPKGPKMPRLDDGQRGGLSPALWENQDQAVSPTVFHRDREGSPTGETEAFGMSRNQFDNNDL